VILCAASRSCASPAPYRSTLRHHGPREPGRQDRNDRILFTLWNDAYPDISILREAEAKPREGALTAKGLPLALLFSDSVSRLGCS
jgi:hypothetical protein